MTDLERGYRRLLVCYPRAFRRENGDEILGVLLSSARDGQRRAGLAESADLIRGGLRMRLRPATPPPPATVRGAVRLMWAGAAAELATLITVVLTAGTVRLTVLHYYPGLTGAQWHQAAMTGIIPDEFGLPVAIAVWLWLAWAIRRGRG